MLAIRLVTRCVFIVVGTVGLCFCAPVLAAEPSKNGDRKIYIRADRRDLDYQRGIGILVGNVRFMPPQSDKLIMADAGVIWLKRKEAYLEGNIRICQTLGKTMKPGHFDVPRPELIDRTGLERRESLEKAGDLDDIIEAHVESAILIDTNAYISEAKRVYVNWADGTSYLVEPTLRFAEADRLANWVVTAPSAEGIATYRVPVVDQDGKFTGKYERRTHYVAKNATFTACTFKQPHTRFTSTYAERIEGDKVAATDVLFYFGSTPVIYYPRIVKDLEYDWPWMKAAFGSSSAKGTFASLQFKFKPVKHVELRPRVELMSDRGVGLGLDSEYHFGHDEEIRGTLDTFWIPQDSGEDELGGDTELGIDNRYRVKFTHQQEYPEGWEIDLEIHKFSDAGIYREFFEGEYKTEKKPETRALVKYGRNNWAVFVHLKKRINDFLSQTEYLPQIGFNIIAQPIGGGFLFTSDTELSRVTTRFGDVRRRMGQTNADIARIWRRRNEYTRPAALTLRQNDTDKLSGWRFDTINTISRPFEWSVFDIEPYIGWRGSWFEHGVHTLRGSYAAATPPVGAALPAAVAAAPNRTSNVRRSQILAGGRIATQFHRTYDVSDRPLLRRFFKHGQRHIITPELTYTYESEPPKEPRHLPDNDAVTAQRGLHSINFALRNRWQTKRPPEISRHPLAPVGGEWYHRKLAVESAAESRPVNVLDLDMDIDLFLNPTRDNVHRRGERVRRWSNLRTDLTVKPSRKTSLFLDTEFAVADAGGSGCGGFESINGGISYRPSPDLIYSLRYDYHFHGASLLRLAADWEMNPKWHLGFDVGEDFSGRGDYDRTIEITRRFHEWQVDFSYEFDEGKAANFASIHIGPAPTRMPRPGWQFQPRSTTVFQLVETAR